MKLILASSSPRRKEILRYAGIEFEILIPNIDETELPNEAPREMVKRLAYQKANKIAEQRQSDVVLGADTTVFFDSKIFGKPTDKEDAFRILNILQGKSHSVWCGYSLILKEQEKVIAWEEETKVTFSPLTKEEIVKYIASGEPMDKAGAYAAQGYGMSFVSRIEGCYSNLLGLDLPSLIEKLKTIGYM